MKGKIGFLKEYSNELKRERERESERERDRQHIHTVLMRHWIQHLMNTTQVMNRSQCIGSIRTAESIGCREHYFSH